MTICIATNLYYPSPGGVPTYYYFLARSLQSTGHNVIVLRPGPGSEYKEDELETQNGISVVTLHARFKKLHDHFKRYFRPGDYEAYSWLAMGYAMKEWLLENVTRYSVDIIETPDYGGLGILLKDKNLPPVLIGGHSALLQLHSHDFIPHNDHATVLQKLETLSFQYADGIVAHSLLNQHHLAELTQRAVHFARAPWIPPSSFAQTKRIKGKYIAVGRLHMTKGPAPLAEAIRLIIQKQPEFRITWFGQDTHTAPGGQLVSSFLRQNFPDIWGKNFIWKGPLEHDRILEETASAEMAFIPSLWETFNYYALEAAFLSTAFIITEKTGSAYLFNESVIVRIIPHGDAAAIAAAYFQLSEINKSSPVPGAATRKYLEEYFSAVAITGDRLPIYNKLIAAGNTDAETATKELGFLDQYLSFRRKTYYFIRAAIKSLLGKNTPAVE